jgi:hypothetical protein
MENETEDKLIAEAQREAEIVEMCREHNRAKVRGEILEATLQRLLKYVESRDDMSPTEVGEVAGALAVLSGQPKGPRPMCCPGGAP